MEQLTLSVENRELTGKGANRRLRRAGRLPGVLYGLGKNASISIEPKLVRKLLLEEGGRNKVLNLEGSGLGGRHAIIKDYCVDPLSRNLLHVDLLEIDVTKKIAVTVPLNFTGKAVGVADGGVLNVVERSVEVYCLPTQIPQHIDVDVTSLKIGASLHLDDLTMPEGIEKASHVNSTLVTVVPPAKEEAAAPSLTPSAEPEVIGEKKDAAPAEGEKKDEKKK